jgi:glycosyltransferase involved in cell wall biosynthesis
MNGQRQRLVIFSDDWGRHPSSAQHLARHLLADYDIDWVNTMGTRRPTLSFADVRRGFEKIGDWLRAARAAAPDGEVTALPPGLRLHAPLHWPGFGSKWERSLNRSLLMRALAPVFGDPPPKAVITTVPITADLAAATPHLNWIYYCVDDLASWPGLDATTLRAMELDLLAHVRMIVAVSEHLAKTHKDKAPLHLLTHGVELDHWQSVRRRPLRAAGEKPVALFWGLADARLDVDICLALAEACDLVMVGPQAADLDLRLKDHPRITWRGAVSFAQLPREAEQADVLVMPYADLPVTRAMQPLKLKEYLATGLPTIVTPLPATKEWADALDVASRSADFVTRVRERAIAALPEAQRQARLRLTRESWAAKARQLKQWIEADADARRA